MFINDHKCYIQPVVEEERDTEEPTDAEGGGRMEAPPNLVPRSPTAKGKGDLVKFDFDHAQ